MFEIFSISLVILLAVISPGPDFVLTTRNALQYSQKAGIMTALGTAIGTLVHSTYCILGFAILISQSIFIFNVIKVIGAAYLIYLGIKGLKSHSFSTQIKDLEKETKDISSGNAFFQGLICNLSNPKTVCFFLALFTMMIKPTTPLMIQVGFAFEIAFIHLIWFSLVSVFFAHQYVKIFFGKFQHYLTKIFGGILILFGLKIISMIER